MRAEIVAVGTELLLGQVVDTNSSYIAEQLAAAGIDCLFQTRVGDNQQRIVDTLRAALRRADAVVVCGGLGPTQDDITREAIAEVMGVELERDDAAVARVREVFARRNRPMTENNLRQADVPVGATVIAQEVGTAPGLICPVGDRVIYAVPGVPHEMREMVARAVLPDLAARAGARSVIASRTIRTFGLAESLVAEIVAPRLEALDAAPDGAPTIAFLANAQEGVRVRLTVKTADASAARRALDAEEAELRVLLGDAVYGIDDEQMEAVVGELLLVKGLRLAVAESFTGGLLAARIVSVPGASRWFTGGIVAYDAQVKFDLLDVPVGPVVNAASAAAMAEGVRRRLHSDVALATTGVAGPEPQEDLAPGTCFVGIAMPGRPAEAIALSLFGGRSRVREVAVTTCLNALRLRLAST